MEILLKTDFPLAIDSPDHLSPWGTRINDSTNQRFNYKLWALYPRTSVVRVLDLGCAGGGFVKSCIDDGQFAVGLEGSDFSKVHRRSAWATIPGLLFTCDVTKPFQLCLRTQKGEQPLQFDVVTAWDFIEHIRTEDLDRVAQNVRAHLAPGGLWIMSIANHEDILNGQRLHQTVQPKPWWRQTFASLGFQSAEPLERYFTRQFVRGSRIDDNVSFHFVLTNGLQKAPTAPATSFEHRLFDRWLGSRPQRLLNRLIVG